MPKNKIDMAHIGGAPTVADINIPLVHPEVPPF